MIRKLLFLFLFIITSFVYIIPTHTGMFTPPSPSFYFVHNPHLHLYPTGTYTKVDEVTHYIDTAMTIIENTKWEPKKPKDYVAVASKAVVTGFGKWKASVTGTHNGRYTEQATTLWIDFGEVGVFGMFPTWRIEENVICIAGTVWPLDKSLTVTPKSLSGSGYVNFQQKVWEPSTSGWVPISGGSWDDGDTERFSVPREGERGSDSYTTKPEIRILCVRHDAGEKPCKTYVMADSREHYVSCDLCNTSYWNCPSLSVSHTCPTASNSKSASVSGPSSASAGSSVSVTLTTSTPFSSVYWYLKSPTESGLGSGIGYTSGGSSSYSASKSHTFSSSASGDYVITAYIYDYSDSSTYEASAEVSVSSSSYSNNDNTPDCSSCTDGCSSCDSSSDDSDSGYTAPSTPSEPSMVRCGASSWTGCSGASSRSAHYVPSCSNCNNSYWTCSPEHGSIKHEVTHTCTRPGCGASYTRCSKGDGTCSGGRYIWHN